MAKKTKKPKKAKPLSKLKVIDAGSHQAEPFNTAGSTRELCRHCGRLNKPGVVGGAFVPTGYTGKVLAVLDAYPSPGEFTEIYNNAIAAGYSRKDVALVPAVRCAGGAATMQQIRCCRPYVLRAIEVLKPELVLAMGSTALRSVANVGTATNITKSRGRGILVPDTGVQAYATYAGNSVLLGGVHYRERIQEDMRRQSKPVIQRPTLAFPEGGIFSIDTEYAPDKRLLTIALADFHKAKAVEVTDTEFYEALYLISTYGEHGSILCGHSLSGDVDRLVELGIAVPGWVSGECTLDSLLLARMKDENRGPGGYDLESLTCSDDNIAPWKQDTVVYSKEDATAWPVDLRRERCRLDAWASSRLAVNLSNDPEVRKMPTELVHRVAMSLHRIRHAGVYISLEKMTTLESDLLTARGRAKDQLTKAAMGLGMSEFVPTNDAHIRELLYTRLKLPVTKTTAKDKLPAVDKVTLKQYEDKPEVKLLLEFNKADKAYSTNVEGLKELVQVSTTPGLLYLPVNINPLGARTGRRSSDHPNMQNWPVSMRQMVVSRFPGGLILENDYKSLEIFLLAYEAKDDKLYDYFAKRGGYIAVAKDLWRMDVKKGTNEYRATKSVVLGTNYNMQTPLMAENLWFNVGVRFSSDYDEHERVTGRLREAYLDLFPGIRQYMDRQRRFLLKHGYVVSKVGQVRHLPLSDGRYTPGFGRLLNQAINFPIQSLASAVTGSSLIDTEEAFVSEYLAGDLTKYHERLMKRAWPDMPILVNEVHDNLVSDVPEKHKTRAAAIMKESMESLRTLRRMLPDLPPLTVDTKIGPHWGMEE